MTEPFSLEQIRDFWTQQAREHGLSPSASWSDRMVIEMEIREILATVRTVCRTHPLMVETHDHAIEIAERYKFSVYDSVIVASAPTRVVET